MLPRRLAPSLKRLAASFPIVAVTGPRQSGKTTLARALFARHRLPSYATPEQAVRAFMHLEHYRHNQALLMRVPPSVPEAEPPDTAVVRRLIAGALAEGREWLNEAEAKQALSAYRIPTLPTEVVGDPAEAAAAAARMGGPVALKILSRDITHKSDIGGVMLDLEGREVVRQAAEAMLSRVAAAARRTRHRRRGRGRTRPRSRWRRSRRWTHWPKATRIAANCMFGSQGSRRTTVRSQSRCSLTKRIMRTRTTRFGAHGSKSQAMRSNGSSRRFHRESTPQWRTTISTGIGSWTSDCLGCRRSL